MGRRALTTRHSLCVACLVLGAKLPALFAGQNFGDVGTFAKWTEVEATLTGPVSTGMSSTSNPFQIQVDVSFISPTAATKVVPAFYDGDGNGGLDGDVWKVRFTPDELGAWSFVSSSSNSILNNYQGTFGVTAPPVGAQSFSKWGRLEYVGGHYLKFVDGPHWIKSGPDEPEDFLSPETFGDWDGKKAQVDYLASKGVNVMLIMLSNVLGDWNNVWPWVAPMDSEHFDVAKLADWKDLFDHIQSKGIVLFLTFEDDSAWNGFNRSMFYREMVARFGHYNGVIWCVSEEYNERYSPTQIKDHAQQIGDVDAYDHPITVHHAGALNTWDAFVGDSKFSLTAFQTSKVTQNAATVSWRSTVAASGHPIAISFDETGKISAADRDQGRHIAWSVYMGGGNFQLHPWPITDFQDFDLLFDDLRLARTFIETLPFWEMQPDNGLLSGGSGNRYCFRKTGEKYAIYLESGGSISLNLSGQSGTFDVSWYNPRSGATFDDGDVQGGSIVALGSAPFSGDAAAIVGSQSSNTVPVAQSENLSTSAATPVAVSLVFVDPDGPGPHVYTVNNPADGTLSGNPPNLTYTPNAGFTGFDSFTWSINDSVDESNLASIGITVNSSPVAQSQSVSTPDNLAVGIALAYSDPDGPGPYAYTVNNPTNGAVSGAPPNLTYTPNVGFIGQDSFTWLVNDAIVDSNLATVTVDVLDVNFVPVAAADAVSTPEDTPVAIALTFVDFDGPGPNTYTVSDPANGVLSGVAPNLTYTPSAEFSGQDSMSWSVNDGIDESNVATVTIDVTPVNDPPVAQDEAISTDSGDPVAVNLVYVDLDGPGPFVYTVNDPPNGTVSGTAPILTYTPNAGFAGADSFTWSVNDGQDESNLATVAVTVNTVPVAQDQGAFTPDLTPVASTLAYVDPDGPGPYTFSVNDPGSGVLSGVAPDLTYTPNVGTGADSFTWSVNDGIGESNVATFTIDVLGVNAIPVADDQTVVTADDVPVGVTLTFVDLDGPGPFVYTTSEPPNGALSGLPPDVTYTPDPGFFGQDSFTWSVNDGIVGSNLAMITIDVNASPVAQDDNLSTPEDMSIPFALIFIDSDGPPPVNYTVGTPALGSIAGVAPNLTYTPNPDVSGLDSFTWSVSDGISESNIATITIDIGVVNDRPLALDDSVSTLEDVAVAITLSFVDVDGPGPFTYTVVDPTSGVLSGAAPNLLYTPNPGYSGADAVFWSINDGLEESILATVTIDVVHVNSPPLAQDDNFLTQEDQPVLLSFAFLDPDGPGPYSYTLGNPSNGALSGSAPNITYTPSPGFFGADSFLWSVNDGADDSNTATLTIDVISVNTPPVADAAAYTTDEGIAVSVSLTSTDPDGPGPNAYTVSTPFNGALSGTPPALTYTPNGSFAGLDIFTWSVNDGVDESNVATVTIDVQGDTILFEDDFTRSNSSTVGNSWVELEGSGATTRISGGEVVFDSTDNAIRPLLYHTFPLRSTGDITWSFDLNFDRTGAERTYVFWMQLGERSLMNDSSPTESGVAVNLKWGGPNQGLNTHEGLGYVVNGSVSQVATVSRQTVSVCVHLDSSTYDIAVDGVVQLSGAAFENGVSIDAVRFFTDRLNKNNFLSRHVDNVLLMESTSFNFVPVASDQTVSTLEDVAVPVALGFLDPDGPGPHVYNVNNPANGSVSGTPPDLTYTPNPGFFGPDSFTWTVNDGVDASNPGTITVDVLEVNAVPIAQDENISTPEDTATAVTLMFVDPDGPGPFVYTVADPSNGVLSGTEPNIMYTPNPGFIGIDSFSWSVNDGIDESNSATVTIDVFDVNSVPVAQDDNVTTPEEAPISITLVFVDPDGPGPSTYTVNNPANGVLSGVAPDLTYTPNAIFFGQDSFTWSVNDGIDDSNLATVTINVTDVNTIPVAQDDFVSTPEDVAVVTTLTVIDPDGPGPMTYTINNPSNGAVSGIPPDLTYAPNPGFSGQDSFTWFANDGIDDSNVATCTVDVVNVNSAPAADDLSVSTPDGVPLAITLTFVDPDGPGPFVYTVNDPAGGVLTGTAPDVTYTPNAATAADSFTWSVNDGIDESNLATVVVDVTGVNAAPMADGQAVSTAQGLPVEITLTFVDPDGPGPFAYTTNAPASGTLTGTAPNLSYTPGAAFSGQDSFTWSVNDSIDESELATITIDVNGSPVAQSDNASTTEDVPVFVILTFVDPDGPGPYSYTVNDPVGVLSGTPPALTYTPNPNVSGLDSITWSVNDGLTESNLATFLINVTDENDLPIAQDDTVSTLEDVLVPITLTFVDPDGPGPFVYTVVDPANGVLSGAAPDLVYTPDPDFSGVDTLTWTVNDGLDDSNVATVTIDVVEVNDIPMAQTDNAVTFEDAPVAITLAFVDSDGPGPFAYTVDNPPNGIVSGTPPNVTYTPNLGYFGQDFFTWSVNDGLDESNLATVTIDVLAVNSPPVAQDGAWSTAEGGAVGVTLTSSDPDGPGPNTYTLSDPFNGVLTGTAPNLIYTPNAGFSGLDLFTWSVNDGIDESNVATATIDVMGETTLFEDDFSSPDSSGLGNGWVEVEAPSAATVLQNGAILFNTSDQAIRPLTYHTFPLRSTGVITWSFDLNFDRTGGEGTYAFWMQLGQRSLMNDSSPASSGVAVNLKWGSPNQGLGAHEGLGAVVDGTVTDLATASFQTVSVCVDLDAQTYDVAVGSVVEAIGVAFDTPVSIDTVRFFTDQLHQNNFLSRGIDNVVIMESSSFNFLPIATGDNLITTVSAPVDVTLSFTDPDGPGPYVYTIVDPANGVLSGSAPDFTYTPNAGFFGQDVFNWSVNDGVDESNLAAVTIDVVNNNVAPVADDGNFLTTEGAPVATPLTFVDPDGPGPYAYTIGAPANGVLTGTAPALTYYPNGGFSGQDSFTWSVNDVLDESNVAVVTIDVNTTPLAEDQNVAVLGGVPAAVTLTFVDPDGPGPFTYTVNNPAGGVLSGVPPDLTYTSNAGTSIDAFTWWVHDGVVDSNLATVTIDVTDVNSPPVVEDDNLSTPEETPVAITLTFVDVDGPGPFTYTVNDPGNGVISGVAPDLTYTPNGLFVGIDTFTWSVNDGIDESNLATCAIDVFLGNAAPVAQDGNLTTPEDVPLAVTLTFSDPDGPGLYSYTVSSPVNGSLTGAAPNLTYAPDAGFFGLDAFTWSVNDGEDESNVATVSIDVTEVNTVPTAQGQAVSTDEDTPVGITLAFSDPDGPGPNVYTVSNPANGTLSGVPPSLSYTPNGGFSGQDSFTWSVNDGTDESNVATITLDVTLTSVVIFEDQFSRPDSATVGNGWVEVEGSGQIKAKIQSDGVWFDSTDASVRPLVRHSFASQSTGVLTWTFDLNFDRSGSEKIYEFWMQLGNGSLMSDSSPKTSGVAVNLKWAGPSQGVATHEGLGHVDSGSVTHIATVSGLTTITVAVDIDAESYDVSVGGAVVANVPFDNSVSIDTVRFFTDRLHQAKFTSRAIESVEVRR